MGLKKVVLTGASTGIGRATTLRFANDGHEVFATARSDSKLSETVKLAPAGKVHKGIGDVAVEADVLRNFEEAKKALGEQIDVIVLNAGVSEAGQLLQDQSVKDFDAIFNTNVRGVFLWLKAILPLFKKQGFGQIIFTNSISGLEAQAPEFTVYGASKFALTGLADGVRLDVKGTGIKVASVFLGPVNTPIWDTFGDDSREKYAPMLESALTPDDIADAIINVAYQSERSDIDRVRVWPNVGLKKSSS